MCAHARHVRCITGYHEHPSIANEYNIIKWAHCALWTSEQPRPIMACVPKMASSLSLSLSLSLTFLARCAQLTGFKTGSGQNGVVAEVPQFPVTNSHVGKRDQNVTKCGNKCQTMATCVGLVALLLKTSSAPTPSGKAGEAKARASAGWHYLSKSHLPNAASFVFYGIHCFCLIGFATWFATFEENMSCVTQVVLDKWFPLHQLDPGEVEGGGRPT